MDFWWIERFTKLEHFSFIGGWIGLDWIDSRISEYHQFAILTSNISQSEERRRLIPGTLPKCVKWHFSKKKSDTSNESSHFSVHHRLFKTGKDSFQR
jgi:hypothetical protein